MSGRKKTPQPPPQSPLRVTLEFKRGKEQMRLTLYEGVEGVLSDAAPRRSASAAPPTTVPTPAVPPIKKKVTPPQGIRGPPLPALEAPCKKKTVAPLGEGDAGRASATRKKCSVSEAANAMALCRLDSGDEDEEDKGRSRTAAARKSVAKPTRVTSGVVKDAPEDAKKPATRRTAASSGATTAARKRVTS